MLIIEEDIIYLFIRGINGLYCFMGIFLRFCNRIVDQVKVKIVRFPFFLII